MNESVPQLTSSTSPNTKQGSKTIVTTASSISVTDSEETSDVNTPDTPTAASSSGSQVKFDLGGVWIEVQQFVAHFH